MEPIALPIPNPVRAALLTLTALVLLGAGCEEEAEEQELPNGGPGEYRDLVYAGEEGGTQLVGDLILPPDVEQPPVVVLVHGGGFYQGHRDSLEDVAQALAAAGVATFNVDYRLVGVSGGEFPASSVDVRDAVRFLRAQRGQLPVGPVCGTWGSSAGGTLAALAAFSLDDPKMARAGWADLRGWSDEAPVFVGLYGVYDFTTRVEQHGYVPWPEEDYLGGTYEDHAERYEYASPATWVDGDEGPVLLLHGEADGLVEVEQAQELRDDLEAVGVPVTLHTYPDAIHSFLFPLDEDNTDGLDALDRSVSFLVEHCANAADAYPDAGAWEVVQAGTASLTGTAWVGEESYALGEASQTDPTCSIGYTTTGEALDESTVSLTYHVEIEAGDCTDAPYAPDNGETRVYALDLDPRDGDEAMFLDDEGRGLFRWFDLEGAAGDLSYGLTQALPPGAIR